MLDDVAELCSHLLTVNDDPRLQGSESPALTCFELADAASFLSQAASSGTMPAGSGSTPSVAELRTATTDAAAAAEWVSMGFKAAPTCSCWSPGGLVSSNEVNAMQPYF